MSAHAHRFVALTVALVTVTFVSLGHAQDTSTVDKTDEYRLRSFVVVPQIAVATRFESNLFKTETRPTSSLKVTLAPDLIVKSDWGRHAVKLELGAEAGAYTHASDDNYLDLRAKLSGELDVTRRFRLSFSAAAERGHDARGSVDLPLGVLDPAIFREVEVQVAAHAEFGRIRMAPFAIYRQIDFDDVGLAGGGRLDQDSRDRRRWEAGLELGFSTGRAWEIVIRTGVFDIDYTSPGSTAGPARDASGFSALGGVELRLSRLIEGRLTAGFVHHDYKAAAFGDVSTLAIDAQIDWHPTRRLSLSFDAGRKVTETALAGAAGVVKTTTGLGAEYELLRTLRIGTAARFSLDDYSGIARNDRVFDVNLHADWSPMRGLTLRPEYTLGIRRSSAAGQDYSAHALTLTATYRFGVQQ